MAIGSQVFISYQRTDGDFAREVREHLTAHGVQTWMDQYDIPVGAYWPDEIDKGLADSDIVVGILSPDAVASRNVKNEWDWALARDRRLLLLMMRPTDVPHRYISINFIDASRDAAAGFNQLVAALRHSESTPVVGNADAAGMSASSREPTTVTPSHAPPLVPAHAEPFVGRDREMAEATRALTAALHGQRQLLLLAGEPGIGKTRLAETLSHEARQQGADVFWGRCYEWEGAPPYWPWVELLRACVDSLDNETLVRRAGSGASMLAQILPSLTTRLPGLPPLPLIDREEARFQLFDAVTRFIQLAAGEKPFVAVLDDLHWADEPSLRLLEYVARELPASPLLLVGTYRDVEVRRGHPLGRSLATLVRAAEPRRIALRGLSPASVNDYLQATVGRDVDASLVDAINSAADGNPFFVSEVARLLVSDDRLEQGTDSARTNWILQIPESVRDVVGRRLDQLSPDCNAVLATASVIGRVFTLNLLGYVSHHSTDELLDLLDEAENAQIIVAGNSFGQYQFRHAFIQQTLYDELSTSRRLRLHGQVGRAIESAHADTLAPRSGELAHHFSNSPTGENVDKAVNYNLMAGDRGRTQFAWEAAIHHYQQALHLLDDQQHPDERLRCETLLALGDVRNLTATERERSGVAIGAGGSFAGLDTFRQATEIARRAQLPEHLARAALGVVGVNPWTLQGGVDGIRLLEEVLTALPPQDSPLYVRILARLAIEPYVAACLGMLPCGDDLRRELVDRSDAAVAMARRLDDRLSLAYALWTRCMLHDNDLDDEPLVNAEAVTQLATDAGDLQLVIAGLVQQIHFLRLRGDVMLVSMVLEELGELVERVRIPFWSWVTTVMRTSIALGNGDLELAAQLIEHVERTHPGSFVGAQQRITLERARGQVSSVTEVIDRSRTASHGAPLERSLRVVCLVETGQHDAARRELEGGLVADILGAPLSLRSLSWLAEACHAVGDAARAAMIYEALLPYASRNIHTTTSDYTGGCVSHYLGLLAMTMAKFDEAEQHFTEALELNERWGNRLYVASTHYESAHMLSRQNDLGDRSHALQRLDQASALASEIGAISLERRANALRERLLDGR